MRRRRTSFTSGCQTQGERRPETERETGLEPATLSLEGDPDGNERE